MSKNFTHYKLSINFPAVLEGLITSKTRIKMLLKFFTNTTTTAYLRELAEEFNESTNSIRHELNNLSKAGYLVSNENGRTIEYRANINHPLFNELKGLVHKYLGIDTIVEKIIKNLGDVKAAIITGDYARGMDTGTIDLLLIGDVDKKYLSKLIDKAQSIINRSIKVTIVDESDIDQVVKRNDLVLWSK